MTPFIDLQRRFRDLTTAELEDPEFLASLNEWEYGSPIGWPELLGHGRILLLAEAGSGKTIEMSEQAKRLATEGKFAFFVALESLDREPLVNLLSASEAKLFDAWKVDGRSPAWFFLDAVDELKLTEGKLDRALLRMSNAIDGHLDRARFVISCRPNDWRQNVDMATFANRLPQPKKRSNSTLPPDEIFLNALRRERGEDTSDPFEKEDNLAAGTAIRTVILLPLSARQIELFAKCSGVHDAAALLAEIDRQNAWTFARRPLDLSELIMTWANSGRLGTRAQQHEANIAIKLKDDPNRPDRGILPDAKARLGAERLALALALTRTRTIRSPEQSLDVERAEGVLDPATILQDWSEDERQALLRRALYDPATYGRVRFHHRSVQEYLAARRLKTLRDKGMSTNALFRLLFAERYGVEVVIPSMRAIAAWLALFDDVVRRELTKREPEALLSLGDPESLRLAARIELVQAFVVAYGAGGWRGLNIPIDEVRRLAHPGLAPTIRELWAGGPANADVRELLIELIWQGAIEACADLAQAAALNLAWDDDDRIVAVRALLACGHNATVREIANAILADPACWPDRVAYGLATDLFPKTISIDELIALMERTREPKRIAGGFGWVSRQIVEEVEPASDLAATLRDKLADLIWRGREEIQEFYRIHGQFDHLTPALAMLCERQLPAAYEKANTELIRACVIASRFGGDGSATREPVGELRKWFRENRVLRRDAFWAELAFMDEVISAKDEWQRLYNSEHNSLIDYLTDADRLWLQAALADKSCPERRPVALHALLNFWQQRGRVIEELDAIRAELKGYLSLETIFSERTAAPKRSAESEKFERDRRRRQCARAGRESQRLENWVNWRKDLLADPVAAFVSNEQPNTVANLYRWLDTLDPSRGHYNVWNKDALTNAFGAEIARRAADAMQALWRVTPPVLWSVRRPEERNNIPYVWLYGLCGLMSEASTPGWATGLTPAEARIASAYATVELNGFASFTTDLLVAYPAEVNAVLGGEVREELKEGSEYGHLPILQDLSYADRALKELLAPHLLAELPTWPTTFTTDTGPRWAHHLDQVLRILGEISEEGDRFIVANECAQRYAADSNGPLALVWLRGLFRFDPERGTQAMAVSLEASNEPATRARAIETFAGLFGDRDAVVFEISDPARRARALKQLVRSAYAFIRHEDDRAHEGAYSPDMRDHAEMARGFLLNALLDTPGPEARRVILEFASEPDFAHFPDRLRLLARQRAAADAEFAPFDTAAISDLESRYEAPPHDRDGLFNVMMDRLEDLAHDVTQHDFSDRRTLRTISDEIEMQRTLALRIDSKANGAFVVTREEEVADLKRTDIRLSAVRGDHKAAIEVKMADARWSLTELERALRDQLVGQYLRHESCKAGCLLLVS